MIPGLRGRDTHTNTLTHTHTHAHLHTNTGTKQGAADANTKDNTTSDVRLGLLKWASDAHVEENFPHDIDIDSGIGIDLNVTAVAMAWLAFVFILLLLREPQSRFRP